MRLNQSQAITYFRPGLIKCLSDVTVLLNNYGLIYCETFCNFMTDLRFLFKTVNRLSPSF